MAPLSALPVELLAQIATHLPRHDLATVRLTNRILERSTLSTFGRRFFGKKGYLINSDSLDVLQAIADHPELRKYVRHVWFNPDMFTFVTPMCAPEEDIDCDDAEDEDEAPRVVFTQRFDLLSSENRERYAAYRACICDYWQLLETRSLEQRLAKAFARFGNLEVVGMRRSEDHSPWGWARLRDVVGEDPRVLGPMPDAAETELSAATMLFVHIVRGIAGAGCALKRLYTDAVQLDNANEDCLPTDSLQRACDSLKYLELNATMMRERPGAHPSTTKNRFHVAPHGYGRTLSRLLQATPNLDELGLQTFRSPHLPHDHDASTTNPWAISGLDSWEYGALRTLTTHVQLHNLTRIKLESALTDLKTLQALLRPSAHTLASLKLRDLRLVAAPEQSETRPWGLFFTWLAAEFPRLEYLLMHHLRYDNHGISFVDPAATSAAAGTEAQGGGAADGSDWGEGGTFVEYDELTFEARGREAVLGGLGKAVERHWYRGRVYTYAMDDDRVWHTDTSDGEE